MQFKLYSKNRHVRSALPPPPPRIIPNDKLNKNIISTHIIYLNRRKRRGGLQDYIQKHPHVHIFDAIYKHDTKQLDMLIKKYKTSLVEGEAACMLSHLHVMQNFLKSDHKYQLILEDDFICKYPLPMYNYQVDEIMYDIRQHPDNVDILYLNNRINDDYTFRVKGGCGCDAYIVTKRGAEKICKLLESDSNYPIDLQIQMYCKNYKHCSLKRNPKNNHIILEGFKSRKDYVYHDDKAISDRIH